MYIQQNTILFVHRCTKLNVLLQIKGKLLANVKSEGLNNAQE